MDRISSLPNEIICHIVSFLSAKEAAFASILSKRFQNLYNIIPNLEFSYRVKNQGRLTDFLDEVLALPTSSRIRKFSIESCIYVEPVHFNRCLCDVLKRGVMELKLNIYAEEGYSLPFEVFTCETIVVLKLVRKFVIDLLPKNAFLPALKILYLDSVRFYDRCGCSFQKLLSACPVLEDLTIHGVDLEQWKWSCTVSSPTLQRLTIRRLSYDQFDGADFGSITFNTPSLAYLHYEDFVPRGYPVVNLDSLVEANLDLILTIDNAWDGGYPNDGDPISSNPKNLFKELGNVEILSFLSHYTFNTFNIFRQAIPVFKNLCHLTIKPYDEEFCMPSLPVLLKRSPNLETLVIEGQLHYDDSKPESVCECLSEYSCLFSCSVEVL